VDNPASTRIAVATVVATIAFWCYTQTLLPGVDLGDTGGFQAAVLWPEVSARQAYPLYYGLARPFVAALGPENPARALNLFSAVWGAVAIGLLTWLCSTVTRSLAAGLVAGLLLAFSYTFWSQAIIAEVYTLHLALIGAGLLILRWYAQSPGFTRLLAVFAVYALAFGNHLSMILMLPAFTLFLFLVTPRRRDLLRPAAIGAGLAIAAAGALQYTPNFLSVSESLSAPSGLAAQVAAFWFDTTKQDWRDTMVMGVGPSEGLDRLAMWWFDARQQFGVLPLLMAPFGLVALWRRARPWSWLVALMYVLSAAFALTYNVGDAHVFFLPAHFITAFAVGAAVAAVQQNAGRALLRSPRGRDNVRATAAVVAALFIAYAGWRGWSTWPLVDRHDDRRGEQLIAQLTEGVRDGNGLFVSNMNWQLENVLLYASRHVRPDLAWVRLGDVMTHWPLFVADNISLGRDVVLDGQAALAIASAADAAAFVPETVPPSIEEVAAGLSRGTPYILTVLRPLREMPIDDAALASAMAALNGGTTTRDGASYEVMAGVVGAIPEFHHMSDRPFRESFNLLGDRFTIQMESWLPIDTFRRAGFGHLLRGRERLIIIERGVNLIWLGPAGTSRPYYAASLFAPQPRFRLPAATLEYARR
jgi:hypothetical protein